MNRIDKNLELGEIKLPFDPAISVRLAFLLDYSEAQIFYDKFNIGIYRLTVRPSVPHAFKRIHNLIGVHAVLSIRILVHQFENAGQLSPVVVHY